MAGHVVSHLLAPEAGEDALAEGGRVRRVTEPHPHVDAWVPGTVLDGLHHDLSVLVGGEVGRRPRLVAKGGKGGAAPAARWIGAVGVRAIVPLLQDHARKFGCSCQPFALPSLPPVSLPFFSTGSESARRPSFSHYLKSSSLAASPPGV